MLIAIDPIILRLGPLAVRLAGLLALLGLLLAVWLSVRALDQQRLPSRLVLDALAWGLPAGLVTARLVYVLGWWDYYVTHAPELQQMSLDGLSLWGGLVGGGALIAARLRRRVDPIRRRRIGDAVAPGVALGIALGHVGAFFDGRGQGVPADTAWATVYSNPLAATPDFGVPRHPVQLYEALMALALWVVLATLPRRLPAGSRLAMLGVLYALGRLALGAVRLDPPFLLGLQIEQLLALGVLVFSLGYGLRPFISHRARATGRSADTSERREDSLAA